MTLRVVDKGWDDEFHEVMGDDIDAIRIVCPFIKVAALRALFDKPRSPSIEVITRFKLADFAKGVSDTAALRLLLRKGAKIRGIKDLHSKLYLFDSSHAIVTSANLTKAALKSNYELGIVTEDARTIEACHQYFERLWEIGRQDLTRRRINVWEERIKKYLASGPRRDEPVDLPDEGADAGVTPDSSDITFSLADVRTAFVKFLGESKNRVALSFPIIREIDRAECHWAVSYPAGKRPRKVEDGDLIYISRLTKGPNDIRVFGRAFGLKHVPSRDDASSDEKSRRTWRRKWPHYVRVYNAEFVDGNMGNGISLNALMEELGPNAFATTQRHMAAGEGNTNPRSAYARQAAVELSREGLIWLNTQLEAAFKSHGTITSGELEKLGKPDPV